MVLALDRHSFQLLCFSIRLVTVLAAISHVAWPQPCRSMCFGFSMVMAKVGTRGSDQQGRDMLSLIPGL